MWRRARKDAFTPKVVASPLAATPYDLRHAAVSTWLNGGSARNAGRGVGRALSRGAAERSTRSASTEERTSCANGWRPRWAASREFPQTHRDRSIKVRSSWCPPNMQVKP